MEDVLTKTKKEMNGPQGLAAPRTFKDVLNAVPTSQQGQGGGVELGPSIGDVVNAYVPQVRPMANAGAGVFFKFGSEDNLVASKSQCQKTGANE
ncbi:hypothetical protein HPP92_019059 [Vanilla planifolia]|uniref:Uncharacterized protein n=1 Tax=Vanilla planifolia TaxID=51239 RepID=A0A835Q860_VANPL|nr:hypothetical protein HPP92_019059 [Vanilla planifolia]